MNLFSNSLIKAGSQFKSSQFPFEYLEKPETYQLPIDAIKKVLTSYKKQVFCLLPIMLCFPVLSFVFKSPFWIAGTVFPFLRLIQIVVFVLKVDNILIQAKLLKARAEYKYDLERYSNAYIPYDSYIDEHHDYIAKQMIMRQWHESGVNPFKHPFEIET
jgi:hypothetical protein